MLQSTLNYWKQFIAEMSGRPRTTSFAEGNKQSPNPPLGGFKISSKYSVVETLILADVRPLDTTHWVWHAVNLSHLILHIVLSLLISVITPVTHVLVNCPISIRVIMIFFTNLSTKLAATFWFVNSNDEPTSPVILTILFCFFRMNLELGSFFSSILPPAWKVLCA